MTQSCQAADIFPDGKSSPSAERDVKCTQQCKQFLLKWKTTMGFFYCIFSPEGNLMILAGHSKDSAKPGDETALVQHLCVSVFLPQIIYSQKEKRHPSRSLLKAKPDFSLERHKGSVQSPAGLSRSPWYLNESSTADTLIHFSACRTRVSTDQMSKKNNNPG